MSEIEVMGVQFDPEGGMVVAFMESTDIRVKGAVVRQQQVRIDGRHPDYGDDIESLQRKIKKVLANAMDDFNDSEPYVPELDDEGDDDDRGMGE